LEPLLVSTRWLTSELAATYEAVLGELYREAAAELGTDEVPFGQLWYPAFDAFVGARPAGDRVVAEFLRRWADVLGLEQAATATDRLNLSTRELLKRVEVAFPATAPGWEAARIHSPDLHICAPTREAAERGACTVVLGELHVSLAAFDTHFFAIGHPEPGQLVAAMSRDVPASRVALATRRTGRAPRPARPSGSPAPPTCSSASPRRPASTAPGCCR
jgi:hypothetical protein